MNLPPFATAALVGLLGILLAVCGSLLIRFMRQVDELQTSSVSGREKIYESITNLRTALEDDMHQTRGMIYSKLDVIRESLTAINGRIGRLEEWRGQHEKMDERDHFEATRRLNDHQERLGLMERKRWRAEERER